MIPDKIKADAQAAWDAMTPAARQQATERALKEMGQMKVEAEKTAIVTNLLLVHHKKIADGLVQVPVRDMLQQVLYLQNNVLPQALAKLGAENESYKFYKGITDTLLWAITCAERAAYWKKQYMYQRSAIEFYRADSMRLKDQLDKYQFAQDSLFGDDNIKEVMAQAQARMADIMAGRDDLQGDTAL